MVKPTRPYVTLCVITCLFHILMISELCMLNNGGLDWIDLAQDRDRWRALVNAEVNLRFP